jgi:hypothetical protein
MRFKIKIWLFLEGFKSLEGISMEITENKFKSILYNNIKHFEFIINF